ncbi:MAG TPA: AAA family ATPase [Steroidobacteraceae bacterium]|jgi:general secretion pathway protein A|nr:AAA family ATPase [Steroidobacteraceae bacterium]
MYLAFFGLNEKPFSITPDPRYLYLSERHAEAMAHLLYGINEAGGFVQLTGEVGTGKTTIVRSLLAQAPKNAEIALILNPRMTAPEFLLTICEEVGIGVPDSATESLKDLVDILSQYLLRAHAGGRRVVLVVDEAQNLAPEVLEQVRLLTNLETNTQKLLQIILIGQPELRELLARNELRQLAQRITGRYHLSPLSTEETTAYVRHRLRVAGATADIFNRFALEEIYRLSCGVPRVINVICDRSLLGGYSQDRHRITGPLVRNAASEVFGKRFTPPWLPWAGTAAVAAILAVGSFALWRLQPWDWIHRPAVTREHRAAAESMPVARVQARPAPSSQTAAPATAAPRVAQATTPAAPAGSPAGPPTIEPLATLLARHSTDTSTDAAFTRLFDLWGIHYTMDGTDPCTQASQHGLACLTERGSLGQLRLYNRPAILILTDANGGSHEVVLTGLDGEHASIDLGKSTHQVGDGELSTYWMGDYVMLWQPAAAPVETLSPGMSGDGVLWLRRSLEKLAGASDSGSPGSVYDAHLASLVRRFQRDHRLTVDGIAGVRTQVALAGALASPGSPLLTAAHE